MFFFYSLQFSPQITPTNIPFVHHIIVYLCGVLVNVTEGQSSECVGTAGSTLDECRQGTSLGGWAVGGGVSVQLSMNEYNPVLLTIATDACACMQ